MMRKTISIPSRCRTTLVRKRPKLIRVGKIGIAALVQLRLLQVGKKTFRQRCGFFRREPRRIRPDRLQRSVQAPDRRRVDAEMNVGRAGLLADGQIFVDVSKVRRSCAPGVLGMSAVIGGRNGSLCTRPAA